MAANYGYNKEYAKKYLDKLDEIKIRLPKGEKEKIRAYAESRGESVNGFIARAIAEAIERYNGGGASDGA